jgi:hypothetical protein
MRFFRKLLLLSSTGLALPACLNDHAVRMAPQLRGTSLHWTPVAVASLSGALGTLLIHAEADTGAYFAKVIVTN